MTNWGKLNLKKSFIFQLLWSSLSLKAPIRDLSVTARWVSDSMRLCGGSLELWVEVDALRLYTTNGRTQHCQSQNSNLKKKMNILLTHFQKSFQLWLFSQNLGLFTNFDIFIVQIPATTFKGRPGNKQPIPQHGQNDHDDNDRLNISLLLISIDSWRTLGMNKGLFQTNFRHILS